MHVADNTDQLNSSAIGNMIDSRPCINKNGLVGRPVFVLRSHRASSHLMKSFSLPEGGVATGGIFLTLYFSQHYITIHK